MHTLALNPLRLYRLHVRTCARTRPRAATMCSTDEYLTERSQPLICFALKKQPSCETTNARAKSYSLSFQARGVSVVCTLGLSCEMIFLVRFSVHLESFVGTFAAVFLFEWNNSDFSTHCAAKETRRNEDTRDTRRTFRPVGIIFDETSFSDV